MLFKIIIISLLPKKFVIISFKLGIVSVLESIKSKKGLLQKLFNDHMKII
jgi:hypothetical protein